MNRSAESHSWAKRAIRWSVPQMARLVRQAVGAVAAVRHVGRYSVYVGRHVATVPDGSIVLFPCQRATVCCGIAGLVAVKGTASSKPMTLDTITTCLEQIERGGLENFGDLRSDMKATYLGGRLPIETLLGAIREFKAERPFQEIFRDKQLQSGLHEVGERIHHLCDTEQSLLAALIGRLDAGSVDLMSSRIDTLKDIQWCIQSEIIGNIAKIDKLVGASGVSGNPETWTFLRQINAVLNSIERLEVRGRDSAGLSLMMVLEHSAHRRLMAAIKQKHLEDTLTDRMGQDVLVNGGIGIRSITENGVLHHSVTLTYKVAAEIGSLGDNPRFLRNQIREDPILHQLLMVPRRQATVLCHTRWASVGAISEANCHPVDNGAIGSGSGKEAMIHVCLNGDIDNYLELRREREAEGITLHPEITTDTKLIPLQIEKYLRQGESVADAFRLAVSDFEGSHAIGMHTDLAPGKLFLAQKGSGQTIFVGLSEDHFMATSEVYGLVEETSRFIKMDGEAVVDGVAGKTQGQIFILDREARVAPEGITACYYDGTPLRLTSAHVKETDITSRDIDRQEYPHYFLKEISEAPRSVERTLLNRWKLSGGDTPQAEIHLDATVFPESLRDNVLQDRIRRIYFIGQGTAGVAAQACANILNYYLDDPMLSSSAMKASELSGFRLGEAGTDDMADALIVAISQSGTTTDTNRTVDMVRERGARTLAIVNRRDSDLTFKADGTLHTSTGRDIEMSVASTKAFYSQIIAGAILGLYLAQLKQRRSAAFIAEEIQRLLAIPNHMRTILHMREQIAASARKLAVQRTYWAAVGSGPNKAAADEIRIKLSELCYKTISSDFVEDKKHIDLSSEPLIIVCAAGTRGAVIGDIVKDTAIFKAHKALPVVIADEGDARFEPYAEDVFYIPAVREHLAPILNTLVGHIWGYYAALSINEASGFLYRHRRQIQEAVTRFTRNGLDVFEIVLEKTFRESIAKFYNDFRKIKSEKQLPGMMGVETASDLTLLLKYLAGRLPVSDFEIDFGVKGTARNMLDRLFHCLGEAINCLARPVDAIKHQAKTVTVGTSRIEEKVEGVLFEALEAHGIRVSQLINRNVLVLKHLQAIVSDIKGSILYRIDGLNLLGDLTDDTTIEVLQKAGVLEPIPSRVETDRRLKGTKRIIVRQGNVYIGKGRKDNRSIVVIPAISASPDRPNIIEHLLLLNIGFRSDVPLTAKVKALGGKFEHIQNIVQENSIPWEESYLEMLPLEELFGRSAEKIAEFIVSRINGANRDSCL